MRGEVFEMVARWSLATIVLAGFVAAPGADALAAADEPALRSRAWEAGFSIATSTVAGNTRGTLTVRTATFFPAPRGLASAELAASYSHVSSLDELGFEAALGWLPIDGPLSPFVAAAGGVRQEWIGSFRESRWPVGFDLGVRLLLTSRVGVRGEYRFRRILDDPVSNFSEHDFVMGLSVFWKNDP